MVDLKEDTRFEQVVRKIDPQSRLLRAWTLVGGISAQVTALEVVRSDGQTKKMVVRRHDIVDLQQNPQMTAEEFKLLQLLQAVDLPTPTPYYLDESGEIFATPYIVLEYIDGKPEFELSQVPELILQFATQLARIHAVDYSTLDVSFLRQREVVYTEKLRVRPALLDESLDEGLIRDVLEAVWPFPQRNPSVLLHGDFWPGNILWKDGRPAAIIDWEDARLGDPLADVANSRMEILWAFGREAMESFTRHYQAMSAVDFTALPYWDLCVALRPALCLAEWAGDPTTEKAMRAGHRWFVSQALDALDIRR
jgi:aminoglycoside phosphotransferase (APT) family kinase protein